eukprot:3020008-Pyramimonas_sp.AAC.1
MSSLLPVNRGSGHLMPGLLCPLLGRKKYVGWFSPVNLSLFSWSLSSSCQMSRAPRRGQAPPVPGKPNAGLGGTSQ